MTRFLLDTNTAATHKVGICIKGLGIALMVLAILCVLGAIVAIPGAPESCRRVHPVELWVATSMVRLGWSNTWTDGVMNRMIAYEISRLPFLEIRRMASDDDDKKAIEDARKIFLMALPNVENPE